MGSRASTIELTLLKRLHFLHREGRHQEDNKMKATVVLFLVCLVTADTVMGMNPALMSGKDAGLQKDQKMFKKMVRAAEIKGQLKQVQDSVASLAKLYDECPPGLSCM